METLERELLEEANIKGRNLYPLGAQKVEILERVDNKDQGVFYQFRFVGELDKLLSRVPDPDKGVVWERALVPASKITEYVK